VVMVFVPFRGGWLVLLGKGTLVHNHPGTKGSVPGGGPIFMQKVCTNGVQFLWERRALSHCHFSRGFGQFDRSSPATQP